MLLIINDSSLTICTLESGAWKKPTRVRGGQNKPKVKGLRNFFDLAALVCLAAARYFPVGPMRSPSRALRQGMRAHDPP